MRFDRRNPRCYAAHARCLLAMLAARVLRGLRRRSVERPRPAVVMYGHSLSGNLKAFFDYAAARDDLPYDVYYATINRRGYDALAETHGRRILPAMRVSGMKTVLGASVIMTSHGPGIFYLLRGLCRRIRFVDVWHGVGFKSHAAEDFKLMRFYAACFLSSERAKGTYRDLFGFREDQLVVTGYPRVDCFQRADAIARGVRTELGLDGFAHVLLYAPTFRARGEEGEIPFGMKAEDFLAGLNALCGRLNAACVFRLHMNSSLMVNVGGCSHILSIPQSEYPDTTGLLTAADLLITDWSSIAADFCVLDRPIVFIDEPMPSTHDHVPAAVERLGDHARSMDELLEAIERDLQADHNEIRERQAAMKESFHSHSLDGLASERYDEAIRRLLVDSLIR
jgi:CDP-glycerol glycerophosphotransferase (TagB/SpsB family)